MNSLYDVLIYTIYELSGDLEVSHLVETNKLIKLILIF